MEHFSAIQDVVDRHREEIPTGVAATLMKKMPGRVRREPQAPPAYVDNNRGVLPRCGARARVQLR